MKILIYGGKGWIGQQFVNLCPIVSNFHLYLGEARCDKIKDVDREIKRISPDRVISFVGRTSGENFNTIDYFEQKGKLNENIQDNFWSLIVLAQLCSQYNIHLTYIGTGCIFDYFDNPDVEPFKTTDDGNFFGSSYSVVKGYSDKYIRNFYPQFLNIRLRMPIAYPHKKDFITKITSYKKICSTKNSMSVLGDLLPVLWDLVIKMTSGTVHLCNPGHITHNRILELYKEYIDHDFVWENFTEDEQNSVLLSSKSKNVLDTTFIEKNYPNVLNIEDSIKLLMSNHVSLH